MLFSTCWKKIQSSKIASGFYQWGLFYRLDIVYHDGNAGDWSQSPVLNMGDSSFWIILGNRIPSYSIPLSFNTSLETPLFSVADLFILVDHVGRFAMDLHHVYDIFIGFPENDPDIPKKRSARHSVVLHFVGAGTSVLEMSVVPLVSPAISRSQVWWLGRRRPTEPGLEEIFRILG